MHHVLGLAYREVIGVRQEEGGGKHRPYVPSGATGTDQRHLAAELVFCVSNHCLGLELDMPFSYMDHTGDVGVEIEAGSLENLLVDASKAFADILTDPSLIDSREIVKLSVQALDPTELLLNWLEELLYLFDTRGLLAAPTKISIATDPDGAISLDAEIAGEEIDPSRHPLRVQIKAVTYHCLEVRQQGDRWLGRVIFDI